MSVYLVKNKIVKKIAHITPAFSTYIFTVVIWSYGNIISMFVNNMHQNIHP